MKNDTEAMSIQELETSIAEDMDTITEYGAGIAYPGTVEEVLMYKKRLLFQLKKEEAKP